MAFALSVKERSGIKVASPVLIIKNRYEIRDVLGRGGMGVVYKAFDALIQREVAVKTLRDVASSVFVDLFYRECSVLRAMVHPNIVEIFDMGEFEEDGVLKPYFVMPLLPGCTLYDLIYPSGQPLPPERCADIISQACRGLHAAHERGLLHRDIKPRNIFVMPDDAVKLVDFGVVRLLGSQTVGAPGTPGTLHYMAPEQIFMKQLTARSDIFSLATVCYEALTGVHPFMRENEAETAAAVAEHIPQLACALNPLVNRALAQAVAQAMAKDPQNRFESAVAFADALQRGLRNDDPSLPAAVSLKNEIEDKLNEHPDVRTLSKYIAARRDEHEQEFRRGIARRVAAEPDLSGRLHILNQAARSHPSDEFFNEERQKVETQLQRIADSAQRARQYESSGHYDYAIEEWLCVGDVYPAYPGLQEQLARVKEFWKLAREKSQAELTASVTEALRQGNQERAAGLLQAAQSEFEGDLEFLQLKTLLQTTAHAHNEVALLLGRMQKAESERRFGDIPTLSQGAAALSQNVDPLRKSLFDTLLATASRIVSSNWRVAQQVLQESATLGPVPAELYEAVAEQKEQDEKRSCIAELAFLCQELGDADDRRRLWDTYIQAKTLAAPFGDDPEVKQHLDAISEQGTMFEDAAQALSRDRIKDCFTICDSMLVRRPGHVLFEKLRAQADGRYHQLGEEYLARVERWLAGESDLYQRELILQKAQEEYPFETRYAEELRELEREKDVAESLAAKARDLEKRGQTPEALTQWRQLRMVHATYPGVDEQIAHCESIIDRAQRKFRAQRLLSQGEAHLAEGDFAQGYEIVREASELSRDIPDLLRFAAPNLVAAAGAVSSSDSKLAEALANLAQTLDDALRIPKELHAKIADARKVEDTTDCLKAIQAHHEAADLAGALADADQFLAQYPGVKQVESIRARLLLEIEQEQTRAQTLAQFRDIELGAGGMGPTELLRVRQNVQEIARLHAGDDEVNQRASTLTSLFSALAEVRGLLHAHALSQAEDACARAFVKFPEHPLFKAALAEAQKQKAESAAKYMGELNRQLAEESDFSKQSALLRNALARFPGDAYLVDQLAAVNRKQTELEAQIEKAHSLEAKHLFGEAIKQWEAIQKNYTWYSGAEPEIQRISNERRTEKQDALDRWFGHVEQAIENGDYETASTMLRQAAQQQPERKLSSLDEKLKDALNKKHESDAKFAEGSRLLTDGDLVEGGQALYRAFELQPKDQNKTNSISLLLLGQLRANMASDMASCEGLLSHLDRIRPGQPLPPDIQEAVDKNRKVTDASRATTRKLMAQLANLASQAENARTNRALSAVGKALQDSPLLDSRDVEVQKTAGELLRKINLKLSGLDVPVFEAKVLGTVAPRMHISAGTAVAAALLLLGVAGVGFFLSRPRHLGVPVQITVMPEHATIELDGHTCIAPNCQFALLPGDHLLSLSKAGYQPKTVTVTINEGESTPLNLSVVLEPVTAPALANIPPSPTQIVPVREAVEARSPLAKIEIRGARPQTRVTLDGLDVGSVAADGEFRVNVPPGPHTVDLSLDGFSKRIIKREFARGEVVLLANEAVQLKPRDQ